MRGLATVVGALQGVATPLGLAFFLMGAAARDLMLHHAHGIAALTGTEDVDFGVMVSDWPAFEALHAGLIAQGGFSARAGDAAHRLRHASGLPLDLLPFGAIENANREFAWPPDKTTVFNCFGMKEAFAACIEIRLPGAVHAQVAQIPALTILKVAAWCDRRKTHPRRDAPDLLRFMHHYMDCGNLERATSEHGDLFSGDDFDYVEAGVRLLAGEAARSIRHRHAACRTPAGGGDGRRTPTGKSIRPGSGTCAPAGGGVLHRTAIPALNASLRSAGVPRHGKPC